MPFSEAALRRLLGLRLSRDLPEIPSTRGRTSKCKLVLQWTASFAVLAAVLYFLLRERVDVTTLLEALAGASIPWLLTAAVVIVANRALMAVKWWLLLRGEGVRLSLIYLVMVTFVGYFVGRVAPGALGMEVVRVWYLARDHGIGAIGFASVVIDRSTGLASLALVALAAVLLFDVPFPGREIIIAACAAMLAAFAALTLAAPALSRRLGVIPTSQAHESRLVRWRSSAQRIAHAASTMQGRHDVVLQALAIGVAAQLVRGVSIFLIFVALGRPDLLPESLAVAPILMFLTMIPLGISSIAIGAAAMVLLLEPAGVAPAVSLSASLLSDALLLILIPVGALCFAAGGYWRKRSAAPA